MVLCTSSLLKVEKSHLFPFSSSELALHERTHCPEARSVMMQKSAVIHFFRICLGFQVKVTLLFSQTPASGHASQVADICLFPTKLPESNRARKWFKGSGTFSFPSKTGFLRWVVFSRLFIRLKEALSVLTQHANCISAGASQRS